MNTVAILCALPALLLLFFTIETKEDATINQKIFTFVIFKLLPFISFVIWGVTLLNSSNN